LFRFHALIPLVAAAASLLVCVPVVRQRGRRPIHWAFAWMTLTYAAWNLGIFSLEFFPDAARAEWWSRVFRVGICFSPIATFHFALLQAGSHRRGWTAVLGSGYAAATALAVANLAGLLVGGVRPHEWGWYPEPTRLYAGVSALVLLYPALSIERAFHAYRHPESARQRTQAKFWFLAFAVQAPFAAVNLLPLYGINVYPLGSFGNVLFTAIIAYAIARHRLMDVDYVVRKIVSFSLAASAVFIPGGAAFAALYRAVDGNAPIRILCGSLALALAATVLIPMLQRALETRLQRALFPSRHDYRARLQRLTAELVHVLERAPLLAKLGQELEEILEVERCDVFARHDESGRWLRMHPSVDGETPPGELVEALNVIEAPILGVELEATSEGAAAVCQARGWEVVMPLRLRGTLTAVILLGRNKDFRLFSGEDLQLLTTIAANASVALENARLSAQLRHSEKVLQQSSRLSSLGMLAAGIAHEIRNPLSAVKTFLDLLPERLDDHDFLTDFRNMSLGELRRVTNLITDLLALGKSSAAKHGAVELGQTLEPVIRLMESTARKRQIEVVFSADPVPVVFANADQLKQITLNLILNAIDASPAGANIQVALRAQNDEHAVLEVLDEGSGMSPETLDHIFDPFYTTKETGTGLGLALVYQMVREHGGDITVESTVGRGTVFRVTLPAADAEFQRTGT
jgi:two-component system, NtrC family, sensor kinase